MSIKIEDTISVHTLLGEYQIQLCYGDISKQEDKMDIVMVSAFPGKITVPVLSIKKNKLEIIIKNLRELNFPLFLVCSCM